MPLRSTHGYAAARHLGLEIGLGWLVGHVDAVAADVELPAVVDAANALFLVATEEQRRAAMRAVVRDQPELAGRDAKGDQVLTQQSQPHRRAVGLRQLARHERGQPVLAHELAHGRPWTDPAQQFVVFRRQHRRTSVQLRALLDSGRAHAGVHRLIRLRAAAQEAPDDEA